MDSSDQEPLLVVDIEDPINPENYPESYFGESIIVSFFSLCSICTLPIALTGIFFSSKAMLY
jgi:hypothetical protein